MTGPGQGVPGIRGGGAGLGEGEGVGAGVGLAVGEGVGLGEAVAVGEADGGGAPALLVPQAVRRSAAAAIARQTAKRVALLVAPARWLGTVKIVLVGGLNIAMGLCEV